MRGLTESPIGFGLVLLALVCGAVGVAANIAGFGNPDSWFFTGAVLAILAFAVAVDQHRLSNLAVLHPAEEWLARSIMALAFLAALAGFVLGLFGDDNRNLWSAMGIILALIALSVTFDAHRVAIARGSHVPTRNGDGLAGVICAAVAFGVGIFGLFTGLFGLAHSDAWLTVGVIFGLVATVFMFDEQTGMVHTARRTRPAPIGHRVAKVRATPEQAAPQ